MHRHDIDIIICNRQHYMLKPSEIFILRYEMALFKTQRSENYIWVDSQFHGERFQIKISVCRRLLNAKNSIESHYL